MAWSDRPNYRKLPKKVADRIRRRDGYTCRQCGNDGHEVDHVVNQAQGGTDHPDNLQVLCAPCHQVKTQQEAAEGRRKRSGRRDPHRHPAMT